MIIRSGGYRTCAAFIDYEDLFRLPPDIASAEVIGVPVPRFYRRLRGPRGASCNTPVRLSGYQIGKRRQWFETGSRSSFPAITRPRLSARSSMTSAASCPRRQSTSTTTTRPTAPPRSPARTALPSGTSLARARATSVARCSATSMPTATSWSTATTPTRRNRPAILCAPVLAGEADMVVGRPPVQRNLCAAERPRLPRLRQRPRARHDQDGFTATDIADVMTGYRAMSRPFVKTFPVLSERLPDRDRAIDPRRRPPLAHRRRPRGIPRPPRGLGLETEHSERRAEGDRDDRHPVQGLPPVEVLLAGRPAVLHRRPVCRHAGSDRIPRHRPRAPVPDRHPRRGAHVHGGASRSPRASSWTPWRKSSASSGSSAYTAKQRTADAIRQHPSPRRKPAGPNNEPKLAPGHRVPFHSIDPPAQQIDFLPSGYKSGSSATSTT